MREIKFRAWNKDHKDMLYGGFYLLFNPCTFWLDTEDGPEEYSMKDFELMQYTGLKDKKDKEIYEGDIIKTFAYPIYKPNAKPEIGQVKWDLEDACFKICGELRVMNFTLNEAEVVGNIYENPELLK